MYLYIVNLIIVRIKNKINLHLKNNYKLNMKMILNQIENNKIILNLYVNKKEQKLEKNMLQYKEYQKGISL